jgi:hypothetical protein
MDCYLLYILTLNEEYSYLQKRTKTTNNSANIRDGGKVFWTKFLEDLILLLSIFVGNR